VTPFLILSERWGIGADDAQWMILTYRSPRWRPVSYVASNKAVLMRCLAEKGADFTPEGQAALDRLPDSFKAWLCQRTEVVYSAPASAEAPTGRKAA
jgi:hypothetical protein